VQTGATADAIHESIEEIAGIRGVRPVTADELATGVAALTRGYARNFETAEQLARAVTQLALYELPERYFDEFVDRVEAVTAADVMRVAHTYLDPARLTTLIVGDYAVVSRDLPKLNLGAPAVLAADTF
jgi:predicted Zn-dependent peptidase